MVDLMLTVSYIDGVFHQREWAFLHNYLDSVVVMIEQSAVGSPDDRQRLRAAWGTHFEELYRRLETEVAVLGQEVMAAGNDSYVASRLRVRALALFRSLPVPDQAIALELITGLIHADGQVTKNESDLQHELQALFAPKPVKAPVAAPHERTLN